MNTTSVRVRNLRVGDRVGDQTVIGVGRVELDFVDGRGRRVYRLCVALRRDNGSERVASWRPDTTVSVRNREA